jgi:hypothetical protein
VTRQLVANLAQASNRRGKPERSGRYFALAHRPNRIEAEPAGKLEIDLYGDLARIPTLAGKKAKPLDQAILWVQQSPVKVVAGVRFVQARTAQLLRKHV